MKGETVLFLCLIGFVLYTIYLFCKDKKKEDYASPVRFETVPTSPEVEFIEGQPDFEMVDANNNTLLPPDANELYPSYGAGPGLYGTGRASYWMM